MPVTPGGRSIAPASDTKPREMRGSVAPLIGVAAGLGALAVAARRSLDRPDSFYAWSGGSETVQTANGWSFGLPMTYHRTEQVVSIHAAALEPVRALLPTGELHPVRLPGNRTLVSLSAARYLEGESAGVASRDLPYGESLITALVTREPMPPLLPLGRGLLSGSGAVPFGAFLLHAMSTSVASRDTGRALGYPSFVADFAFRDGLAERRVSIAEGGREILRLRAATRGRLSTDRRPMVVYNVRGEKLMETVCPCSGIVQQAMGRGAGLLELGDHPVAAELQSLEISSVPLVTRSYLNLRIRIPPSRVIGQARPFSGYAGVDSDGRYTIAYPDGSVIDLHSIVPPPLIGEPVRA